MEIRSKNNLLCYCVLLVLVIVVHYVLVLKPDVIADSSQSPIFSWPAIGVLGFLGLLSVLLLNLTKIKGLWEADIGIKQKVIYPCMLGLLLGTIQSIYDLLTGVTSLISANMGVESIHIAFPYSM